jgi:acetyl-CoA carboxylase biotin carboxyl carrier protein
MTHTVRANMAGTLLEILVKPGDQVAEGQDVVTIESMKMHLSMPSDRGGKVVKIRVNVGDFVNENDPIVDLDAH